MYLKSIELHGFKSFIDKTKLEFEPGVSVIVGPNGSGKSNIADAIRWVLGEQSAKTLRGSKMEDVIFAGTKKRKPLGMAEVCLTLDNSEGFLPLEFNEVTVTRRTYRSGEGEYLINNVPCRLKDIHNLFVDTGMGNDGFFIIGQGKVDEILTAKPEERRSIIEETAGIVKYRNRKKEAVRKLQDTEQNLERIQDIIYELSAQLEPLKEQSEKAAVYQRLRAESDQLEINLIVHTMEDVREKLNEARQAVETKQLDVFKGEALSAKYESQIEELRFNIELWDEEINKLQQEVFQVFSLVEQTESEGKLLSARRDTIREEMTKLNEELKESEQKATSLAQDIAREESHQHSLEKSIREYKDAVVLREDAQKEKADGILSMEREIESLKNNTFELVQIMADIRNKISGCEQRFQTLDHLWARLTNQEQEFIRFLEHNEQKKEELEQNSLNTQGEKGRVEESISNLEKEIMQLQSKERNLIQLELKKRDNLQTLKARLNLLSEMQHDYEGYYPGVKSILLAARKKHPSAAGVVGVMAELIKVPEQVRVAVETALGGGLQDIVTETDLDAKKAIEYLKNVKGGRATFLPLNTINQPDNKDLASKIQGIGGVIGFAADLITCEDKVRPAVSYLLKRILVVKDMDAALAAARALRQQAKVVTLEGDLVNPGGSLTGGSQQKRANNLLSRMSEIEDLQKGIKNIAQDLHETERLLGECREKIDQQKSQQQQNQDRFKELEHVLAQYRRDEIQLVQAQDMTKKNLSAVQLEIADNRQQKDSLKDEKTDLEEELQKREKEKIDLTKLVSSLQEQLKVQKESLTEKSDNLTEFKIKLAALTQEETAVKKTISRIREEKDAQIFLMEKKMGEKSGLEQELSQKEKDALAIKNNILQLNRQKEEKEGFLNQKKHQRTAESQHLAEIEKEEKETNRELDKLRQELHQWELKKSRMEMEWEKQMERLQDKFHLNFEQALLQKEELPSRKAAVSRITEIEREIASLGSINLSSIDEYQRVNERHGFLSGQQQDLLEAKVSLFKVIGEMDRIMTQRFQATFDLVSIHFNNTFNKLFGGGSAELRLTNPENILETGIDIVVQPPGKKLQHLNLLSGGEKAMTGIALLFAILNVRPSPFCVLDEIEAALDEANVDRFAAYMYELSAKTQFIAVSHRQGTMEIADVLYGITMEESGVSKSLSVKLADLGAVSA
ncbi:MAG: chromosome segregation protein SMC [Dehalobacterium sp.]